MDTNAIPPTIVQQLAEDKTARQLSLTYDGPFGFKGVLTINVGAANAGEYGNLYYYDSTGRLIFMNGGKIDENGNVSLYFTHASDYVIVIDKKAGTETPSTPDNSNNNNGGNNGGSTPAATPGASGQTNGNVQSQNANAAVTAQAGQVAPKTGDVLPAVAILLLFAAAACILASVKKRRTNR